MQERGFTFLDFLLATLITLPILCSLALSIHSGVKAIPKTKELQQIDFALVRLEGLVAQIMDELDMHTLSILPRIHKNSIIRFRDGSLNPVMRGSKGIRPDRRSDAITTASLDIKATQTILSQIKSGGSINFYSCSRFGNYLHASGYHSFIGMSALGFTELIGDVRAGLESARFPGKHCYNFTLFERKSMLFPSRTISEKYPFLFLIPIKDNYTLYVDGAKQLRYLSHAGPRNIENQPVIKEVNRIKFKENFLETGTNYCIQCVRYFGKSKIVKSLTRCSHLGRTPFIDFLLNRP